MPIALSLFLVVFFLLMNAFFVVAEFSLVRIRKSQVDIALESGKRGAKHTKTVSDNVNAYLSACQLGITLASLALGWLGEPAVSQVIHPLLSAFGLPDVAISAIAVAIGFIVITALHIVVGELIPKSLAIFSTEKYALATATPLVWFYRITYPIMWLFNTFTNFVMRLAGHDVKNEHEIYTEEEIKLLIDESAEGGLVDKDSHVYVDNIFDLGDKDAEGIMTPRTDLICIDVDESLEENMKIIQQYKFTRYPAIRDSKDNIIGFVHIKDIATLTSEHTMEDLKIRTIHAVPESMPIAKLLQMLQEKRTKIAVVVDEHGGTSGIVTMSDIMDQIVGRMDDEYIHDDIDEVKHLGEGHFQIDGSLPMDDLVKIIGFEPADVAECETAAGLLLNLFGDIPVEGDTVSAERDGVRATFAVRKMDARRIEKIFVIVEVLEQLGPQADEDQPAASANRE